jgi:hypothetical protein
MIRHTTLLIAALAMAAGAGAAEPEAAAPATAADAQGEARAYVGIGLVAASHTTETSLGDLDSSGGGIAVNGVGHSARINPSLDIAFRGEGAIIGREFDGGGKVADALFEVDGGLRISEILLLTLGYTTLATGYENPDVVTTYNVIPVGIGLLRTTDSGYLLAQLRVGGGRLGNDQNDDTESVGYVGLRAVVQHGFSDGVQFMLALGLDSYDVDDLGITDRFVRLDFGLGFGF